MGDMVMMWRVMIVIWVMTRPYSLSFFYFYFWTTKYSILFLIRNRRVVLVR
ncbi:hypothetical protein HanIR_Chr04g0151241 [Helianthus annuus]|nr:hypothetical protein HanIR_Chr04g0151241 [Helianthus annuus]